MLLTFSILWLILAYLSYIGLKAHEPTLFNHLGTHFVTRVILFTTIAPAIYLFTLFA